MALNGYFYGTTDNPRVKPKISWAAKQNTEENYSEITVTLSYSRTNTGYTTSGTWEGKITIGEQVFTGKQYVKVEHESNTVAMTATARVYHDEYGALTVPISAGGAIATSSVSRTTIKGQAVLDEIPLVSAVSAANASIGSRATIVVVRKNDAFTHSLAYRFGSLKGFINPEGEPSTAEWRMTAATVNFRLSEDFYGEIPNSPYGLCMITCRTYNGSELVGESVCQFTVTADRVLCAPEVMEFQVLDTNPDTVALTGDSSIFVRYASTAHCYVAAQGRYGAQIVSLAVNGRQAENGSVIFPNADAEHYELTVIDSRGFSTKIPKPVQQIPYVVLTCQADAQRIDPTADSALITLKGNCWKGNFGGLENGLTITCTVADSQPQILTPQIGENHTYDTQLTIFGVSYTQSYPVKLTISDGVQTITRELTIRKGVPVFDWGEHEFRFHVPVVLSELFVGEQTLEEYIRAVAQGGTT